ncbi:MAG: glycine--tRNA ligase subunit beta, partial [Kiloniellales bacterium]|nr:glycine--tRNA ligase subunit beta [Kiloniellales bacterium]
MAEFLLELLSEEIPARMQARAAEDLRRLVTESLSQAGLSYDDARAFVTPRRLALVVEGLPDKQPDVAEERKGPKVGAPEKAVEGFMKANGLASIDEAEVRETEKGSFYFAVRQVKGRHTKELIPEIATALLQTLPWPKSMRWGASGAMRWVRPLHNVLAVFDGEVIGVET